MFVGRKTYLKRLEQELRDVRAGGEGRFVVLRGRRRVGKSRLVEEFLRGTDAASLYFTASKQAPKRELELFVEALGGSSLSARRLAAAGTSVGSWEAALSLVASSASQGGDPVIVVIDELPYLLEGDSSIEGTLQKVWDRVLQDLPVLLIVVGSDLSVMEALTGYGKPLYGRPTATVDVRPFSPSEVAEMLGMGGREALEAYAVVGGLPFLARSWRKGRDLWGFLEDSLVDPASPLVIDGGRILDSEFPGSLNARRVLSSIGTGQTTFTAIGRAAGLQATSLSRILETLVEQKRVVAVDRPLSAKASREKRYRVADPYLRFWLAFIAPALPEIERERGKLVLTRMRTKWPDYCGTAIEPLVREALVRTLPDPRFDRASYVGSYWTRTGSTEVDLVLATSSSPPTSVEAVGSVKWRESRRFGRRDRDELVQSMAGIPGASSRTPLIGVSATGFAGAGMDIELGPDELLAAWREES